jgi:hypothetical protein
MVSIGTQAPEAPDARGASSKERAGRWLLMVALVVVLAGLLFGYDQGVISGALEGIQ